MPLTDLLLRCDATPAAFGYRNGRFANGPNAADQVSQAIAGSNSIESSLDGSNYS
jgi:hypothetical protein